MDQFGKPQHAGDMHGQIALAFENVETILRAADMTIANVVKFVIYTTDVDSLIQNLGIISSRFAAVGVAPAQTMLGVSRLFLPQLLVEFEATAVA
jgi:enamine deaminase RidA (YjgF/YER057c/UK114 family)